jgi:hypothetical protein
VDVEGTIKFILDAQAKAETRQAQADARYEARQAQADARYVARQAQNDARLSATEKSLDKRMDGIAKLLKVGMRMLVANRAEFDRKFNALVEAQMRTEDKMEELAAAQKDTQQTLKAFIDSLRKGSNGRQKGPNGH